MVDNCGSANDVKVRGLILGNYFYDARSVCGLIIDQPVTDGSGYIVGHPVTDGSGEIIGHPVTDGGG